MNEHADQKRLDQIERLLNEGKPTGISIIDDLARTVPEARPAFQKALEDRLIAHLHPAREESVPMFHVNGYTRLQPRQSARASLTLLVALITVAVVITLLFFSRKPAPQLITLAQLTPTPTPKHFVIPADLKPVVITSQDMPRGTRISGDIVFQLQIVYWPIDLVPPGVYSQMSDLAGLTITEDIAQWQPILAENVAAADSMPVATLPPDRVAVSLPLTTNVGITYGIQEGDTVDIIATMLSIDVPDDSFTQLVTPPPAQTGVPLAEQLPDGAGLIQQRVIQGALVVSISEFSDGVAGPGVTLAVSPHDATTLTWLIEAQLPLQLQRVQSPLFAPDDPGSCGMVESQATDKWVHPLPDGEFKRGFSDQHTGVDFVAPVGTAIRAAGDGAVIFAGWSNWGYGNTIVLAHGTVWTMYAHLGTIRVKCGEQVEAGETIGTLGNTGNTSGPHLHFEMRRENVPLHPIDVMPVLISTDTP